MKTRILAILWFVAALILACLSGCDGSPPYPPVEQTLPNDYAIVRIDGCQYITRHWDRSFTITHKGNCDNPIHKHAP